VAVLNEPDKTNGAAVVKAYSEGLYVAGERFVATRVEDRHIYGRKVHTRYSPHSPSPSFLQLRTAG
jgi:profilin